jgi:hypothetical protein
VRARTPLTRATNRVRRHHAPPPWPLVSRMPDHAFGARFGDDMPRPPTSMLLTIGSKRSSEASVSWLPVLPVWNARSHADRRGHPASLRRQCSTSAPPTGRSAPSLAGSRPAASRRAAASAPSSRLPVLVQSGHGAARYRFRRLCEVEVVTPRRCWGLTSWTCTRRARPATTGGRAEDVRPKRHKAAIDGRERQRRTEGGKPRVSAWRAPGGARRSRSRVARRLRTVLGTLPGPAGMAR